MGQGTLRIRFVMSVLILLFPAACKEDTSETKSYLGLQAGQNEAIRDGKAPTFIAVSDWFQKFVVHADSSKATGRETSMEAVRKGMPKIYRTAFVDYLDAELKKAQAFLNALAKDDDDLLKDLLRKETLEMYDIIMVMLNPKYEPRSGDLFARYIKLSRGTSYVDVFAEDFLAGLMRKRLLKDIQKDLELERSNYEAALNQLYLADESARGKLKEDLFKNIEALKSLKQVVKSDGLNLVQGQAPQGSLSGPSAAFSQYGNGFFNYAQQKNIGSTGAPPLSILSSVPETNSAPANPDVVDPMAGGNSSASNSSPTTPPSNPQPTTPPSNGPGNNGDFLALFQKLIPANWSSGLGLTGGTQDIGSILPGEPATDCRNMDLSNKAMIICQRHYAYAQTQFTPRPFTDAGSSGFNLQNSGGNADIIYKYATRGLNQGAVPSCTAYGLAHSATAQIQKTRKGTEVDPEILWSTQGQQTYLEAALNASQSAWSGQGVTLSSRNPISTEAEMTSAIDRGIPVYIGIPLASDWTSSGGGLEFGLTGESSDGMNLTTQGGVERNIVTCQSGGNGHAVSIQGYANYNGRRLYIVKNSWGENWGEHGYAYLDWSNCGYGASVYAPEFNVQ